MKEARTGATDMQRFSICDLRDKPELSQTVADRIWRAWWQENGAPLSFIEELVAENLQSNGIPMTLVAHHDDAFMGTVSIIESDMEERPQYGPWIAALWVDKTHRMSGTGSALLEAAMKTAFGLGKDPLYLCATPENSAFYEKRGWMTIETGVGGLNIFKATRRG